ncbi:SDR family NAD(P)-dependent oxidoreductase [Streptomyces inhibens]|uniref:SDR family NAD(P)-dependent oxidoreductase n=1 Tax=Streptomyces inhibens TaxID=2293571 RepID=A0A371PUW8_STRIH|nr:SDR family oxidoreductase [Streptomyces inhibens]REK86250.1 SDR family NAD(P)-dependent oxidoreductase [Streptomyces inhibens]
MGETLNGKVALVTGGSRGIGAATARALADEGADVAISYVASADRAEAVVRELAGKGVRACGLRADQADPGQVQGLVSAVVDRFGRLDILVNNAGVSIPAPLGDSGADTEAVEQQYAINIGGVVAAVRAAAQVMGEGGRIVSVGSLAASRVGLSGFADYAATKAAIVGYSRGAARDLAPRGITVNVVQPGPVDTDMNPAHGELAPALMAQVPLGRYGRPEEIAAAIVFLAGPAASYITGAVLDVDGGAGT